MSHNIPNVDPTPPSLLQRLAQPSNREAWARFVDLYTPLLVTWVRKLGVPESDRADVLQEIFATLSELMPTFQYDPHKRFRGYLFTITRTKANDRHRQIHRAPLPLPDDLPREDVALQQLFASDYRSHLVARAIELAKPDFEEKTWKAFWETVTQGRPPIEVAKELGMSPASVYQARTRIIRKIRLELDGLLD